MVRLGSELAEQVPWMERRSRAPVLRLQAWHLARPSFFKDRRFVTPRHLFEKSSGMKPRTFTKQADMEIERHRIPKHCLTP